MIDWIEMELWFFSVADICLDWAVGADPAVVVFDATTPITAEGFEVTISGTVTDGINPILGVTITFSHNGHTETTVHQPQGQGL